MSKVNPNTQIIPPPFEFRFIPIQTIFENKICSKPCFYEHLKAGDYSLYKFGRKSFVDKEEFLSAFKKITLGKKDEPI